MIIKIKEAVADMQKQVGFDSNKHLYHRIADGILLQGVSTVSSIVPKPWLSAWGGKECSTFLGYSDYPEETERAEKMLAEIKEMNLKQYLTLLKEAKGASARKAAKGRAEGTKGHDWIEKWVKAKIDGTKAPKIPKGMLERPCKLFVEWAEANVKQWILSEAMVANVNYHYAGTLDGMCILKTGELALLDFKFSAQISEDAILQTAGYAYCFEMYGIKVDKRIIIRLPKTLLKDEYNKKTRTYSKVPNNLEPKEVKTDYEEDKNVFLHCLPVKRWINKIIK